MTHSLFGNALLPMTELCITMMTLADDNDGTHVMAQCSCLKGHIVLMRVNNVTKRRQTLLENKGRG